MRGTAICEVGLSNNGHDHSMMVGNSNLLCVYWSVPNSAGTQSIGLRIGSKFTTFYSLLSNHYLNGNVSIAQKCSGVLPSVLD